MVMFGLELTDDFRIRSDASKAPDFDTLLVGFTTSIFPETLPSDLHTLPRPDELNKLAGFKHRSGPE